MRRAAEGTPGSRGEGRANACLHALFEAQAARAPEAPALLAGDARMSYGELNQRANRLARRLIALGVGREARVGLCLEPSMERIVALLAVLKAGGAYVPLDPAAPQRRLAWTLADAGARLVLAGERARAALPAGAEVLCLDADRARIEAESAADPARNVAARDLAYVIYTSGSTGAPKGVMVEQGGLARLGATLAELLEIGPACRVLQFASLTFDASLFEIAPALAGGAALYLAAEEERAIGEGLLGALRAREITHAALLPSVLAALPDAALPALRVVVCGGEVCPAGLVARYRVGGRRVFNTYGPTEATVSATLGECTGDGATPPIGWPLPGVEIRLLDDHGREAPAGTPGEIHIGGEGVARGYQGRAAQSAERFLPDPWRRGGRLARTGDLARRRPDGALEFLGRRDDQVKIRGVRIEPGEVEAALAALPGVREIAVIAREDRPGERRLVAYVAPGPDASACRRFLEERLPEALIPAAFVALPELPRLPGGKVDRAALPAPGGARPALATPFVAPRTPRERDVTRAFEAALGVAPVGVDDDFFELGGDSLSGARALARLRSDAGRSLPLRALFAARTAAELARCAEAADDEAAPAEPPLRRLCAREAPLSFAQQRLWFLHQLDPQSAAYHLPSVLRLRGALDVAALQRSLGEIARRHEALRTTFAIRDGAPAQIIGDGAPVALAISDLWDSAAADREKRLAAMTAELAAAPFDLERGPLWRAHLVRLGEDDHALISIMHHIVVDGASMEVWLRELSALYQADVAGAPADLPEPPVQYADFAAWQRGRLRGAALEAELKHWTRELAGAPRALWLPGDRPRPEVATSRGGRQPLALSADATAALRRLAHAEGATLFMVLLAGFAVLLHGWSEADDLVIGTAIEGRGRRELEDLIGFFSGTLAVRVQVDEGARFRGLLAQVRARALGLHAHPDLPFEQLVEALRPERDAGGHPIFRVAFALQGSPRSITTRQGLEMRLEQLHADAAPFDLLWQAWEQADAHGGAALAGTLIYSADLFDARTAAWAAGALRAVLERAAAAPDAPVSELARLAWPAGREALDAMAVALLQDRSVEDCVVRLRAAEGAGTQRVAYVVPSSPLGGEPALDPRRLPEALRPDVFVPIAAVPLTPGGHVDVDALERLEVIDADLARRWEARLRGAPGVGELAALLHAPKEPARRLHLADLIPEGAADVGAAGTATTSATATAAKTAASLRPLGSGAPAFSDGGPLIVPEGAPTTLTEGLLRTAASSRAGVRYVDADGGTTFQPYAALLSEAKRILAGLRRAGLQAGGWVVLQIEGLRDHLAAFWACVLGGITPVTVAIAPSYETPNGVNAKLHNTWALLDRPPILASRRLVQPILGLRALFQADGVRALAIEDLRAGPDDAPTHAAQPEDVAFLQLTSGSTGVPKCIQETHRGILQHIHAAAAFNGYGPGDVTMSWLPFDHVVPILTCHLKDVVLGCDQVLAPTEQILADPLRWLDLLAAHRVTHTWSPNFGFKRVSDALAAASGRAWDLSSLRRMMNAGEQVTPAVVRELLRRLAPFGVAPEVMQPAFGMAEVCTCMTYQNRFDTEAGAHRVAKASLGGTLMAAGPDDADAIELIDLGRPVPGVQIRIADARGRTLPESVIGRLQIRGAVVTPGYLRNPEANAAAFEGDGWFTTGDLGFLLDGRLTVTGREKETIIVRGANLYCYEVEEVAGAVDGVEPTCVAACASADPRAGTEGLAIFFVAKEGASAAPGRIAAAVRTRVTERLGVAPACVIPLARQDFPKTTSGKIQRAALTKALAEGRFERALRELDLEAGNARTLPDWFYRVVWRRREAAASRPHPARGAWLVLTDGAGLGELVAAALEAQGSTCVVARPGAGLRQRAPRRFEIDPHRPEDFARVVEAARAAGPPLVGVAHLWTYGGGSSARLGAAEVMAAQALGAQALVLLAQALAAGMSEGAGAGEGPSLRLLVASTAAQAVLPGDAQACEKATLLGVVRTMPLELPWLDARHVDLIGDAPEEDAAHVLRELRAAPRDREIAYRAGQRWVAGIERGEPGRTPPRPPPFVEGGTYLLSGGLGGIGVELSRWLLERHRARLLLIGRTPLESTPPARRSAHRALMEAARHAGGDVRYEALDVADAAQLQEAAERAENVWQHTFDGVIHLAGVLGERLLLDETPESFAATLRPKVAGTLALQRLLEARPEALLIGFSSTSAHVGGFSAGAYAAANRFLEASIASARRAGRARSHAIAWGLWDETGMTQGHPMAAASRARGYLAISPAEGLRSLVVGLRGSEEGPLLVGLDGRSWHVARAARALSVRPRRLTAWLTADPPGAPPPAPPEVRDRFGAPSAWRLRRVERLPRMADGAIDVVALEADGDARRAPREAPRSDTERTIASIWADALGLDRPSVHDNFFDLGGHSMLLLQLRVHLHSAFGRDVPLIEMFRHPTIRALAAYLEGEAGGGALALRGIAERARRQHEALDRRRDAALAARRRRGGAEPA